MTTCAASSISTTRPTTGFWRRATGCPVSGSTELVFGIAHYRIINAAFTHASPLGSRFNGPERGAWYAGFELRDFAGRGGLAQSGRTGRGRLAARGITYDDYHADFGGGFHDIRDAPGVEACLSPTSYVESQAVAERLLAVGSAGILCPSVRHPAAPASPASVRRWSATYARMPAGGSPGTGRRSRGSSWTQASPSRQGLRCGSDLLMSDFRPVDRSTGSHLPPSASPAAQATSGSTTFGGPPPSTSVRTLRGTVWSAKVSPRPRCPCPRSDLDHLDPATGELQDLIVGRSWK